MRGDNMVFLQSADDQGCSKEGTPPSVEKAGLHIFQFEQ